MVFHYKGSIATDKVVFTALASALLSPESRSTDFETWDMKCPHSLLFQCANRKNAQKNGVWAQVWFTVAPLSH